MRIRLSLTLHLDRDRAEPAPEREGSADALVEHAETPRVGFAIPAPLPPYPFDDRTHREDLG